MSLEKEPTRQIGEQGAVMYDAGRSIDQVKRYMNSLKQIVDYINKNNLPKKEIYFS